MSSSKFEEYLGKVTSRVKWKAAHSMIKKELTIHLEQLSSCYQNQEYSKQEAEEKAIAEMGNPYTVGENLNRLHKPKMDWVLVSLFFIIAGISFLPLVGGIPQFDLPGSYFLQRQALWYTFAISMIIIMLFFDYRKLLNWWKLFIAVGITLLLFTHFFGVPKAGIMRWVLIGNIHIDVSGVSLFFFFVGWAGIISKIHDEFTTWKKQVLVLLLFWFPILLYTVLPQFITSIIYFVCVVTMFAFSGVSKKFVIKSLAINGVFGIAWLSILSYFIMNTQHRLDRLLAFINPVEHAFGAGYINLLISDVLSQAGWFGNGIFNGINMRSLPESHTDYVFPWLVYSLGWTFGIFLCLLLLLFICRISVNALKTKDLFGRLLVMGGAALFTVPICWNILMVVGLLPITGVSLPFISYGGTMLLFYSAVLGIILSVYRRKGSIGDSSPASFGSRNSG
ncbi:FtsW/RodA/SpoVE family cell cycle protein [Evansella sp. AB-rgal1]|uniref:FtsW/RodA/SpoVE family cell cycle protein n=1 Tax=Evansella sp. AB-rgal1 TaxID=3242696 RepID=UPI00359CCA08